MNKVPSEELLRAMESSAANAPDKDRLEELRARALDVRAVESHIADLEKQLEHLKHNRTSLLREILPEMMDAIKVGEITVAAEGNYPAMKFSVKPFYSANISAKWEPQRKDKAFAWLETHGAGDLIKTTIEVTIPREDRQKAKVILDMLKNFKVPVSANEKVHSATLTSWLKETVEAGGSLPPLDLIGAAVGRLVKIEEKK